MKKGLGKGLAALIGDLDEKSNDKGTKINNEVATDQTNVPIEFLVPNRDQPRKNFSETSLAVSYTHLTLPTILLV